MRSPALRSRYVRTHRWAPGVAVSASGARRVLEVAGEIESSVCEGLQVVQRLLSTHLATAARRLVA